MKTPKRLYLITSPLTPRDDPIDKYVFTAKRDAEIEIDWRNKRMRHSTRDWKVVVFVPEEV